ncbi:MAG: polyprenyl synthetase family protein [Desulfurivibrio sp.]|nr:polyprenyl synthetase family protein [Desulfurivibrio sp.]MBU3937462.1 polyprenyl synthetase family protein [Pseudomonadota bacterium]MBU4033541.1 polyprenyl synthetase family protein [Pseudomonadota bacterium]MBU4118506.1 polyprenyl synthetase family protein [Pseudomonadota bacterium]
MNNGELLAAFKEKAVQIDAVMEADLAVVESPLLAEIIRHAIFQGGKRIRPLLTLLAASLVGNPPADTPRLAISFEYLHAASLLHDDVIDHATLRRGAETANTIWGMEPVILAGDYLHAHAMALASEVGGSTAMALIGRATAAMVESEFMQMHNARESLIAEEKYFQVLMGKTAALIAAACEAGIAHNQGSNEQRIALRTYGTNLGLAFQIVDDLLDYLGDPAKTGKAVGNDFQEGKMTLPLIKTLEKAEAKDRDVLIGLLKATSQERSRQIATAHAIIEKYQGFSLARTQAESLLAEAIAGLAIFGEAKAKDSLIGLAQYVLSRDK